MTKRISRIRICVWAHVHVCAFARVVCLCMCECVCGVSECVFCGCMCVCLCLSVCIVCVCVCTILGTPFSFLLCNLQPSIFPVAYVSTGHLLDHGLKDMKNPDLLFELMLSDTGVSSKREYFSEIVHKYSI